MIVFSYIGSSRPNSLSLEINNKIVKKIEVEFTNLKYDKITKRNNNIIDCIGCRNCFFSRKCILDNEDNFYKIRNYLKSADVIILGIPIYLNNVSGHMKTFFDRIAYYTHIFELSGKFVIPLIVTDYSGDLLVSKYVDSILTALGMKILGNVCFVRSSKKNNLNEQISYVINNLKEKKGINEIELEEYYKRIKEVYLNQAFLTSKEEKNYVLNKGFLNYEKYSDLFESKIKEKKI